MADVFSLPQIYFYMPSVDSVGGQIPTMIPAEKFEQGETIAYIDLDLPPPSKEDSKVPAAPRRQQRSLLGKLPSASSEQYHCIDFEKTEAFNKTRHKAEEKYKNE